MQVLTRTAVLLALVIVFQSLRFFIPLPPLASTLLIGSLVNAALLVALYTTGIKAALVLAVATPVVAYLQQVLLWPVFIIPVALANAVYVGVFYLLLRLERPAICLAAAIKTLLLYTSFKYLLAQLQIPTALATNVLFVMSWPQLITGIAGAILAGFIYQRYKASVLPNL